jgi:hypothetical protein
MSFNTSASSKGSSDDSRVEEATAREVKGEAEAAAAAEAAVSTTSGVAVAEAVVVVMAEVEAKRRGTAAKDAAK